MKKPTAMILTVFFLLTVTIVPATAQTAKDVLNKMIEAQGGRKLLSTIKDTTIMGNFQISQMGMDISGTITMYQKEPNKMRMDMDLTSLGMYMSQGYDGQQAWATNMQTGIIEAMPADQAEEFARQAMGLEYTTLNPEKYGITFELKPRVTIDEKEYIVLDMILADGFRITQYIDPSTYYAFKTEMMGMGMTGGQAKIETFLSDYKKVGQIPVAHTMRVVQDGQEFMHMTMTNVTYNTDLEDGLFAMQK
jgi:outer membrane lipoprotein-sorting protein